MILFLTILFPMLAGAQTITEGTLFELKSNRANALFKSRIEVAENASKQETTSVVHTDLAGKVVVREEGLLQGAKLISYSIERSQTGEKGSIRVEDGKVYFEYEDSKGNKRKDSEKIKGQVVCSANFLPFVKEQWDRILTGQDVDVRFAVWDRLETVGFTIKKMGEQMYEGKKLIELRMKPTSFVIAALVDPLYFLVDAESKDLRLMKGRVPPKQLVGGSWKDLDAEVIYKPLP